MTREVADTDARTSGIDKDASHPNPHASASLVEAQLEWGRPGILSPTEPASVSQVAAHGASPLPASAPRTTPTVADPDPSPPATIVAGGDELIVRLEQELAAARKQIALLIAEQAGSTDVIELDDDRVLQEVGIYLRYHHPLENSEYPTASASETCKNG